MMFLNTNTFYYKPGALIQLRGRLDVGVAGYSAVKYRYGESAVFTDSFTLMPKSTPQYKELWCQAGDVMKVVDDKNNLLTFKILEMGMSEATQKILVRVKVLSENGVAIAGRREGWQDMAKVMKATFAHGYKRVIVPEAEED